MRLRIRHAKGIAQPCTHKRQFVRRMASCARSLQTQFDAHVFQVAAHRFVDMPGQMRPLDHGIGIARIAIQQISDQKNH